MYTKFFDIYFGYGKNYGAGYTFISPTATIWFDIQFIVFPPKKDYRQKLDEIPQNNINMMFVVHSRIDTSMNVRAAV